MSQQPWKLGDIFKISETLAFFHWSWNFLSFFIDAFEGGNLGVSVVLVGIWSKFSVPNVEGALLGSWTDIGSSLSAIDLLKKLRIVRGFFFFDELVAILFVYKEEWWELLHWPKRHGKYELDQSDGEMLKLNAVA